METLTKERILKLLKAQLAAYAHQRKEEDKKTAAYLKSFQKAIGGQDPTAILIRGHLYVENELTKMLRNALPRYQRLEGRDWSFRARLDTLAAIGLISEAEWAALKKLNDVRNDVAHVKVKDQIPAVTSKQVHELWSALAPTIRELFGGPYSQSGGYKKNLRGIIEAILMTFFVRAEIRDEFGLADFIRYNLTGETVQQRIKMAHKKSSHDPDSVRKVKKQLAGLSYSDRGNVREWMREVYHN